MKHILKIAFLLLFVHSHLIWTLNLTLNTWHLTNSRLNKSLEEAVKEYFETKTNLLSVAIHLEYSQQWQFVINDYLTNVLKRTESMHFEIYIDHHGHERRRKVFHHNIWYVDSHKAFCDLLPAIEDNFVESMGQYMVAMTTASHLQADQEIQKIFVTAFEWNIVDIAVATFVDNFTFYIYTYDIFLPQQCRQVKSRKFNVFYRGDLESKELFPQKLRNFHKCPIDIYIRPVAHFFSYNLTEDQQQIDHYEGLEAEMVRTMSEKLNFQIRLKHWNGKGLGNVHSNGIATGPFRMLRQGQVDIMMGYFHNPTRYRYFAVSTPYFLAPQVMVVRKRPMDTINGWWLTDPFDRSVWLIIVTTIAAVMFAVSLCHYNLKITGLFGVSLTWLDIFGLSLCNSRSYEFRCYITKYGFIMWTWGFIVICASFGSELYGAFHRTPTLNPVTISQLIKANYTFFLKRVVTEDLIRDLQIPGQQIKYHNYSTDDIIYEAMLLDNRKVAVLTSYWEYRAFVGIHKLNGEYEMVPGALITNQISAYLRPQSFLLEPLNKQLDSFLSVGIFEKWKLDAGRKYGIVNEIKEKSSPEPKALSLAKVRVIFLGLLILNALALVVFVGEIVVKKMVDKWN